MPGVLGCREWICERLNQRAVQVWFRVSVDDVLSAIGRTNGQKCQSLSTISEPHVEAGGTCCTRDSLGAGQPPYGQVLPANFSGALDFGDPVLPHV